METINVLIDNNGETLEILVLHDCSYVQLVDMVMSALNFDQNKMVIALHYDVGSGLALIRRANDNAVLLYLRLKSKEHVLPTYPLRVTATNSLENISSIEILINLHNIVVGGLDSEHITNSSMCSGDTFACSVYQTIPDVVEVEFDIENCLGDHLDGIDSEMIFRDKKISKKKE
ncbi:Uncharacterized protein Adt_20532 [Abeliophyllum distichum]|uniref:Uncharacterized protein n=1 Tax=Abeliophyllum distichum TaxID=126358 RepID=A0ABD1SWW2_9LAMI